MRFILFSFSLTLFAQTADFSKADALFVQRENNLTVIAEARALYEDILNNTANNADRLRAMNQLGRLAYYEGELLTPLEDTAKRMDIFARTQLQAEQAGSAYWKALSLALWCQSAGSVSAWWYLDDFKNLMQRALTEDQTTDGGGIFRLLAAVYVRSKDLESYGLYNPALALEWVEKAIILGPQYLSVYWIKAQVLKELGRADEAFLWLKTTLENFKSTPDFEPENKIIRKRMRDAF